VTWPKLVHVVVVAALAAEATRRLVSLKREPA